MSEIKVNKLSPRSGTDVTLGDSGDTFTVPAGASIVNNGTATGFGATVTWDTTAKTANFNAVSKVGYFVDTTLGAITVTLPATPSAGDIVGLVDYAGTFDTNALVIDGNGEDIEGGTDNVLLTGEREGVVLIYVDSTQGWLPISGINEGTDALEPLILDVEYLVVAGGAGGGRDLGGGGGAGGFRTGTLTSLATATNFTVTVGGGGAGSTSNNNTGTSGSNSVFSTITSAGGGGGGSRNTTPGLSGGSGGGGGGPSGTGGAGNTPNTSPSQGNAGGGVASGGGGGASAVGANGSDPNGGNGGNGSASSITGSSVTYAGGGGGAQAPSVASQGGTGGGGNGGAAGPLAPTNGTTNLGGGGGAESNNNVSNGGSGGSGIVILKYSSLFTISNPGGGLTSSTSTASGFSVTSFTAGTGNVQWN
jgi:hypothetical protein